MRWRSIHRTIHARSNAGTQQSSCVGSRYKGTAGRSVRALLGPSYYAAGNVLRPLETAGWSFREGRRIGNIVADDLAGIIPNTSSTTLIERAEGIKLVMPQRLVQPMSMRGLEYLQVRVDREARGTLSLTAGGKSLWKKNISLLPERRLLIPLNQIEVPENTGTLRIAVQAQL